MMNNRLPVVLLSYNNGLIEWHEEIGASLIVTTFYTVALSNI